ncbi:MAG: hypothetical protein J2P19_01810 [Pseudonocardia sp.]|nr:hypothetical protein [Pseudonocardia sp.]
MTSSAEVAVTTDDQHQPTRPPMALVPSSSAQPGTVAERPDAQPAPADGGGDVGAAAAEMPRPQRRKSVVPLWRKAARGLVPPDIVRLDRPSLQRQAYYAWYGEQCPEVGPARFLSKVYAVFVSLPAKALAYWFEWICEAPARLVLAYLTFVALMQIPAVRAVTHFLGSLLLWPLRVWVH